MLLGNMYADGYKFPHFMMYPKGVTYIQANITPRSAKYLPVPFNGEMTVYGILGAVYSLRDKWDKFFNTRKEVALVETRHLLDEMFGKDVVPLDEFSKLHDVGFLPIRISAIPEGEKVGIKIPIVLIENTNPEFAWVVMFIETLLSSCLWKPNTVATIAASLRTLSLKFSRMTCDDDSFVPYQYCDFSMRGLSNPEDSLMVGAAHLTSFLGTDSASALKNVMSMYHNRDEKGEIQTYGVSALATEHSIMMMWMAIKGEKETILTLLKKFPNGILSLVVDTVDYWNVMTNILADPEVKEAILNRNGKTVFRPDSGDPEKIVCGDPSAAKEAPRKGSISILEEIFGSTTNSKGYTELNPKVGLIYGDSINFDRSEAILLALEAKGYASNNIVFGVGSYTYQYITRDSLGFAMKPTYFEMDGVGYNLLKDPATDDGVKKSATGKLLVEKINGSYRLTENAQEEDFKRAAKENSFGMVSYYHDGVIPALWTTPETGNLYSIRQKIAKACERDCEQILK